MAPVATLLRFIDLVSNLYRGYIRSSRFCKTHSSPMLSLATVASEADSNSGRLPNNSAPGEDFFASCDRSQDRKDAGGYPRGCRLGSICSRLQTIVSGMVIVN